MRKILENGYLEVENCPIAKSGIFAYHTSELGIEGNKMVNVRIPYEVLTKNSHDFDLPITLGHTWLGLNSKKAKKIDVIGQVSRTCMNDIGIEGRAIFYDKDVIKGIMDGSMIDELSPAFKFRIVKDEENLADFVATDVFAPNHIALVSKGRMGKDIRVVHEAITEEINAMEEEQKTEEPVVNENLTTEEPKIEQNETNTEENTEDTSTEEVKEPEVVVEEVKEPEIIEVQPEIIEEPKPEVKEEEKIEEPKVEEEKIVEKTKEEEPKVEEPQKVSYGGVMYTVVGKSGKTPLPHIKSASIRY